MAAIFAKIVLPVVISIGGEEVFIRPLVPVLYSSSSLMPFLPKAYAGMLAINCIGSALTLITLGGKVGAARRKAIEEAKKDGDDPNAEDRYSYPKMYAEGFSKSAKLFNCIQRGHQHALETYTPFVIMSLIGAIRYPVSSALGGLLWIVARFAWADGYATGDPNNRYSSLWSVGVWTSLVFQLFASIGVIYHFVK